MKKVILYLFPILLLLSCEDLLNKSESSKYGSLKLSFNKPSEELIQSLNNENNRSQSQFVDVDAVRISINGGSPATVSIINGSASYSKTDIAVGSASIKVDLVGGGATKYTQTKSVTIIADQITSTSFNAFAITNQSISYTSSIQSTYDTGDIINLSWTNTHGEQPVDIERWDQIGGVWVKTKTIQEGFVGTSYIWSTQGESSGESVKVRIQSNISNSFVDTQVFQLLSTDFIRYFTTTNGDLTFNDVIQQSNGNYLIGGFRLTSDNNAQPLFWKLSSDGSSIWGAINSQTYNNRSARGYEELVYGGDNLQNLAFGIYSDKNFGGNSSTLVIDTINHESQTLPYETTYSTSGSDISIGSAAVYTKNNINYLVVGISYLSSSSGWNASTLIFQISSDGNLSLLANWGWHSEPGDQMTIDLKTNGQDKHIQTLLVVDATWGYSEGSLVYFRRNDFDPSAGSSSVDWFYSHSNYNLWDSGTVSIIAHREFNSEFKPGAFSAISNFFEYNLSTSYFDHPTIGTNLITEILDNDSGFVTNGTITTNGDYVFSSGSSITSSEYIEPTLHIFDSSLNLTNTIILSEKIGETVGSFYDVIENNDGDLVAVGYVRNDDSGDARYALFYISGSSNKNNLNNSNMELNLISPSQSNSFSGKEFIEMPFNY